MKIDSRRLRELLENAPNGFQLKAQIDATAKHALKALEFAHGEPSERLINKGAESMIDGLLFGHMHANESAILDETFGVLAVEDFGNERAHARVEYKTYLYGQLKDLGHAWYQDAMAAARSRAITN